MLMTPQIHNPPSKIRHPEDTHWWFASRTRALLGLLDDCLAAPQSAIRHPQSQIVLDVGCGAGNMIHHLQRYGQVMGIDNFAKPLLVAEQRGYDVRLAPAEAVPFDDAHFDLAAALDVIEHCDDDALALRECARVLRPGGLLAVTVPAFPWLWSENDAINGHRRRYAPAELRQRLEAAGLRVRRLTCNNFFVLPLAIGLILLRRLLGQRLDLAAPQREETNEQTGQSTDRPGSESAGGGLQSAIRNPQSAIRDEDAYQVEMQPAHPLINTILTAVGATEAALLRRVSLPLGTGLIAIAQKPS